MIDPGAGGHHELQPGEAGKKLGIDGCRTGTEEGPDGAGVGGEEFFSGERGLPGLQEAEFGRERDMEVGEERAEEEDEGKLSLSLAGRRLRRVVFDRHSRWRGGEPAEELTPF